MSQKNFWPTAVRSLCVACLGLLSLQTQAAPTKLYLYKVDGMPYYSNRKPENLSYTEVTAGRMTAAEEADLRAVKSGQVAAAVAQATRSCMGITEQVMQERATKLQTIVTKYAKAHGVPAGLIRAVMRVESCFDLRAVSRVGARGLMQLMPATASELGVRDSFDAEQNIRGGVRYLRVLLDRFDHDARLAVAAYNAGPGAVTRHKGIPPFPETRRYVERVMAAYRKSGGPLRNGAAG